MDYFKQLPLYEFFSHLVIGVLLMPLLISVWDDLMRLIELITGYRNIINVPLNLNAIYFGVVSYSAGLCAHKFVEFFRGIFRPRTTIEGGPFSAFFRTILISNNRRAIRRSQYDPTNRIHHYYQAYERITKDSPRNEAVSRLNRQEAFLRNLLFVFGSYVVYFMCCIFHKCVISCLSFFVIIFLIVAFIFLLCAYYQSQRKVYETIWESEYFVTHSDEVEDGASQQ